MIGNEGNAMRAIGTLAVLALLFLNGCGTSKEVLHIYTWSDYIKPETIAAFEKQYHCEVTVDTFDCNETMYTKLRAGGNGYDLVFPSTFFLQMLVDANMIQPFNLDLLPNVRKNFDARFRGKIYDPSLTLAIPYTIFYTGLAYNKKQFPDCVPSWSLYLDPRFSGRATLIGDMRMTLGAALKALGYSLNSTSEEELQDACALVLKWKKQISRFENEAYKTGLASDEFKLCMAYSGDIAQVQEESPDITFIYPKEGFPCSCDEMCIPTDAQHVELAHRFVDFLYQPEQAAENIAYIGFCMPVRAAYPLLPEAKRNNPIFFPSDADLQRAEPIRHLGSALGLYIRMWDVIKAKD